MNEHFFLTLRNILVLFMSCSILFPFMPEVSILSFILLGFIQIFVSIACYNNEKE